MELQYNQTHPEIPSHPVYDELICELRATIRSQAETIAKQAEKIRMLTEEIKLLKKKLYGSSSERGNKNPLDGSGTQNGSKNPSNTGATPGGSALSPQGGGTPVGAGNSSETTGTSKTRVRLLSEQYPNAEIEVRRLKFDHIPLCSCCNEPMVDSGLDEVTEQLHTIPAKHKIVRQVRPKFRCAKGLSGLVSVPLAPRIAMGSSLGDSFILEAALSKFHWLIPAERYARMVAQSGFDCFAPQLILAGQHYCADFLRPVYRRLKRGIQNCTILYADETPHRMLEGDDSDKTWYLWGFTGGRSSYFEIHNTRSGSVAVKFLAESQCLYLMTDVYSGYIRAVREANAIRRAQGRSEIIMLYCNSHSRRRFTEAAVSYPDEAQFFIEQYAQIYRLEKQLKTLIDPLDRKQKRAQMKFYFEAMVARAEVLRGGFSDKSTLVRAIDYFLGNYHGLTQCLNSPDLPLDNNISERQLRCPVIGRKTWLGTHSERGAETTQILFTIFQSCSLAKVSATQYLGAITKALLSGDQPFTPHEYLMFMNQNRKVA